MKKIYAERTGKCFKDKDINALLRSEKTIDNDDDLNEYKYIYKSICNDLREVLKIDNFISLGYLIDEEEQETVNILIFNKKATDEILDVHKDKNGYYILVEEDDENDK